MANNLVKYRSKHGFTQEKLGEKLGVTKATISYIEKNRLSAKQAQKCAKILNENVFNILGLDAFKIIPKTEEDKNILIETIKNL